MKKRRQQRLEMLSLVDEAWYDGQLSIEGPKVRVHFKIFNKSDDEFWDERILKSTKTIKEHVRLSSVQMQDSQCSQIYPGMAMCANYRTSDGDESKYFDATILQVQPSKHRITYTRGRGEEQLCSCVFRIVWESGPLKSQETSLGCGDLSFVATKGLENHDVVEKILRNADDHPDKTSKANDHHQHPVRKLDELEACENDLDDNAKKQKKQGDSIQTNLWNEDGLPSDILEKLRSCKRLNDVLEAGCQELEQILEKQEVDNSRPRRTIIKPTRYDDGAFRNDHFVIS